MKIRAFTLSLALAKQGHECVIKVPEGSKLLHVTEINTVPIAYFLIDETGKEKKEYHFMLVQTNYEAPNGKHLASMRCSFTEWHVFLLPEDNSRGERVAAAHTPWNPEPILVPQPEPVEPETPQIEQEVPTKQAETPPEIDVEGATSDAKPVKRKTTPKKK